MDEKSFPDSPSDESASGGKPGEPEAPRGSGTPGIHSSSQGTSSSGNSILEKSVAQSLVRLLDVLPVAALLVDQSHCIVFANKACEKIKIHHREIRGEPFSSLFGDREEALKAQLVMQDAFVNGTRLVSVVSIGPEAEAILTRMHFRSVRVRTHRLVLVLVEDLSAEKRQLLLRKKHEEELEKARIDWDREVDRRTEELKATCEKLRLELSRRDQKEEALRASETKYKESYEESERVHKIYRSLLHSCVDPIVLYDMEGKVRCVNESFTRMFGWTLDEIEGRQIPYLPESEREASTALIDTLITDGIPFSEFETKRYCKDGSIADVSISGSRYHDHQGNAVGLLVVLRDIGKRKRAADRLIHEERIKAVSELAGGVAHNFNNILQIVLGGAQIALTNLKEGDLPEVEKNLERIVESSTAAAQTAKSLQDFARVRNFRAIEGGTVFDLSRTVDAAIENCRGRWESSPKREEIKILFYQYLESNCLVKGQEDELFRAVVNLINNAVEALPEGGEIKLKTVVNKDKVLLQVQDNGIGIPKDNLALAFEPFWTTKGFQATGMGLASSLGIVRRHHGDISIESEEGKGTTVTIRLPRSTESIMEKRAIPQEEPQEGLKILVVDDMKDVANMLEDGLSELGHEVFTALSGRKALDIFERTPVDVIVCDLGMPEMDGWEVGEAIKKMCAEKGQPRTPFILLTGWGQQAEVEAKIAASGVDRVVQKPISLSQLTETLKQVVGQASEKGS